MKHSTCYKSKLRSISFVSVPAWELLVLMLCVLMLPVQAVRAAAGEIVCARLTSHTRTEWGAKQRVFEIGVLKKNGTFTANPDWGMTWVLFVGSAEDAKFKVGGYYNQAPLALSDIPKMKPFYGSNFTITRIVEEYDDWGNRDPAFDYYEVTVGGPGGVRREDGTEITSPQLGSSKQEVKVTNNSSGGTVNLAEGADVMAPTRYTAKKLPAGFSLTTAGVLTYPVTQSGGVWDVEIQMSNALGSATNRVLVKSTVRKEWEIRDIASVPGWKTSTNVAFTLENPGNLPDGIIDDLEFRFYGYFPGRPIAGSFPSVYIPWSQVTKLMEGTFIGGNSISIQHFNGRQPAAAYGSWSGFLSGISLSRPKDDNFYVDAYVRMDILPPSINDAAPPTTTGSLPKKRKVQTTDSAIRINGTATDDMALSHVSYQVERQSTVDGVKDTSGRCSGRHIWSLSTNLHPGLNKVIVTAMDYAGKSSRSEEWEVTRLVETDLTVQTQGEGEVAAAYRGTTRQHVGALVNISTKPKRGYIHLAWATQDGTVISWQPTLPWTVSQDPFHNTLIAVFVPTPYAELAGTYRGLVWDTDAGSPIVGQSTVTITKKGGISASVAYDGQTLKMSGPLDGSRSLYKMVKLGGRSVGIWVKGQADGSFGGHVSDPSKSQPSNMQLQRLAYSAKNPVPAEALGRFNLGPQAPTLQQKDPHAFVSLEVKPNGQVRYVACSAWGEKVVGSTFWGDARRADIYAFIKGKTTAQSRSFVGQASLPPSSDMMTMRIQSALMVKNPELGSHLFSTALSRTDLTGLRYFPLTAPYLFQIATVPETLDLYCGLQNDPSPAGLTWTLSAKGALKTIHPGSKNRLIMDRKTGLWTGTLEISPKVATPFMALTCGPQAVGAWTMPNGTFTPLNTDAGAIWIQESTAQ